MKILFLSLLDFESLEEKNIYTDLLREFRKNEHEIYVVSPRERRKIKGNKVISGERWVILKPVIGNIQKTGYIEKGISTITLEYILLREIKKIWGDMKFDLVLYPTPPISFQKVVSYIKKRDGAVSYLMLKDIFPQNAIDIGILSKTGWKGLVYKYFRRKEQKLYDSSDYIGCMSPANVEYLLKHNPEIKKEKVEVCPNCIEPEIFNISEEEKKKIRKNYKIPESSTAFIYGGNLGKPQGIPFVLKCVEKIEQEKDLFFVIVGSGTEYEKIFGFIRNRNIKNTILLEFLPKTQYRKLLRACDVGMIFLDWKFTIPNFPSRLLEYMEAGCPVITVTDANTDIGDVVEQGKFGWKSESNNLSKTIELMKRIKEDTEERGRNAIKFLQSQYSAECGYSIIMRHFEKR